MKKQKPKYTIGDTVIYDYKTLTVTGIRAGFDNWLYELSDSNNIFIVACGAEYINIPKQVEKITELKKNYDLFSIVTSEKDAFNYLNSKASTCWGNGSIINDYWVHLATFSPQREGDKQFRLFCPRTLVNL